MNEETKATIIGVIGCVFLFSIFYFVSDEPENKNKKESLQNEKETYDNANRNIPVHGNDSNGSLIGEWSLITKSSNELDFVFDFLDETKVDLIEGAGTKFEEKIKTLYKVHEDDIYICFEDGCDEFLMKLENYTIKNDTMYSRLIYGRDMDTTNVAIVRKL